MSSTQSKGSSLEERAAELALQAIRLSRGYLLGDEAEVKITAAIAAALRLTREETLEEAAQEVEGVQDLKWTQGIQIVTHAIRALREKGE